MVFAFFGGLLAAILTTVVSAHGIPDAKLVDDPSTEGPAIRIAYKMRSPGDKRLLPVAAFSIEDTATDTGE